MRDLIGQQARNEADAIAAAAAIAAATPVEASLDGKGSC